jgi:hypothetical protein
MKATSPAAVAARTPGVTARFGELRHQPRPETALLAPLPGCGRSFVGIRGSSTPGYKLTPLRGDGAGITPLGGDGVGMLRRVRRSTLVSELEVSHA